MAFVSRSERKLQTVNSSSVGPGAYIIKSEYNPGTSYAPFSSTSQRDISKIFAKNYTPGPGTYNYPDTQTSVAKTDYLGQPKFSPAFLSNRQRFEPARLEDNPGPGNYTIRDPWVKRKKDPVENSGIGWARIPTAPSIPTTFQSFGYEQAGTGELIMQKNQQIVYSGVKTDSVGPGQYNLPENRNSNGPKWHKSNSSRELYNSGTTGPALGPGCYSNSRPTIAPMYKFKQNAVFSSKSKANLKTEDFPGPGSYSIDKISGFKSKKLPSSLQNFGSSSVRFDTKHNQDKIGPGYYGNADIVEYKPEKNKLQGGFGSNQHRFDLDKSASVPGPGYYKLEVSPKRKENLRGGFGSTQHRFDSTTPDPGPGPGYYKPELSRQKKNNKSPNAVFISKVKRDEAAKPTNNPSPGTYEITSGFATSKKPNPDTRPILSKVNQLQKGVDLGFFSSTERFRNENERVNGIPGPGSYDYNTKNTKSKIVVSKEQRFKEFNKKNVPGPGAYYDDNDEIWNKKSYNVLFSEVI